MPAFAGIQANTHRPLLMPPGFRASRCSPVMTGCHTCQEVVEILFLTGVQQRRGQAMKFDEVLDQVRELLQSKGRVAYRALKRRFELDDEYLEDLKAELIKAEGVAADENGEVLVWVGPRINGEKDKRVNGNTKGETAKRVKGEKEVVSSQLSIVSPQHPSPNTQHPAERRQLTVMFCDLVGSTALSAQLDPEELREVVQAYQETGTEVVRRYEGHIAQHLGDGLLVYFGYPTAHEDDATRAVRAGLEIIQALRGRVTGDGTQGKRKPLQVRIGIHTGLVVIGEIGSSEKR
jgi:class 3 adenylate cyclase